MIRSNIKQRIWGWGTVFLLLFLLSPASALAAHNVDGVCDDDPLSPTYDGLYGCVELGGFVIEVKRGEDEEFPIIDGGNSVYGYLVTGLNIADTRAISHLSLSFPICSPELEIFSTMPANPTIIGPGEVDPSINRGPPAGGDESWLKFSDFSVNTDGTAMFEIVTVDIWTAEPRTVTTKNGQGVFQGLILGPSCILPSLEITKDCAVNDLNTDLLSGFLFDASAAFQVCNDGDVTFPTDTDFTITDKPQGYMAGTPTSSTPDPVVVTSKEPLEPGECLKSDGFVTVGEVPDVDRIVIDFMTDHNPPTNEAMVSALLNGTSIMDSLDEPKECTPLQLSGALDVTKDCDVALVLDGEPAMVVAKVNFGGMVCNTGMIPLDVTLEDDKAGALDSVHVDAPTSCESNANCTNDCTNGLCLDDTNGIFGNPVCQSYSGMYKPAAIDADDDLIDSTADDMAPAPNVDFNDTVTATGTSDFADSVHITNPPEASVASAECDVCE